jgi:hypothetical protein
VRRHLNLEEDAMSSVDPGLTPKPDEQQEQEDIDVLPGEEPGMTPPATAPEPGTLPEEPDVTAPEREEDDARQRI